MAYKTTLSLAVLVLAAVAALWALGFISSDQGLESGGRVIALILILGVAGAAIGGILRSKGSSRDVSPSDKPGPRF